MGHRKRAAGRYAQKSDRYFGESGHCYLYAALVHLYHQKVSLDRSLLPLPVVGGDGCGKGEFYEADLQMGRSAAGGGDDGFGCAGVGVRRGGRSAFPGDCGGAERRRGAGDGSHRCGSGRRPLGQQRRLSLLWILRGRTGRGVSGREPFRQFLGRFQSKGRVSPSGPAGWRVRFFSLSFSS